MTKTAYYIEAFHLNGARTLASEFCETEEQALRWLRELEAAPRSEIIMFYRLTHGPVFGKAAQEAKS